MNRPRRVVLTSKWVVLGGLVLLMVGVMVLTMPNQVALAQSPGQSTPPPNKPITLKDPCALDPRNLVLNGSMGIPYNTKYGTLPNAWSAFVMTGTAPPFRWVDNEQIDPHGSLQMYTPNKFDAGIYQTVRGLVPGTSYWFRLGYSLAAKSYDGPNVRVQTIGRKAGVDPLGGADAKSPNVIWGPDLFDGNAALNRPEMTMVFTARAPAATLFLRAMATDQTAGENRVWFDAVCMEARPDIPGEISRVAAPAGAAPSPTRAATPTASPTRAPTTTPTSQPQPTATVTASPTPIPSNTPAPTLVAIALPTLPVTTAPTSSSAAPPALSPIALAGGALALVVFSAAGGFVLGYWSENRKRGASDALPKRAIELSPSFFAGLGAGLGFAALVLIVLSLFR
ncbi:MAG: hypothetical protein HY868_25890 [Chloroflexi bacterium]|nr:hypothetical protein [Chloroflexota bacterium]